MNKLTTKEWEELLYEAPEDYLPGKRAVVEVIRLRKAIAALAAEERATADDEFFPVHLRDLCRAYADDLDNILEGEA